VLVLWGGALLAHVPEAALAGILLFVAQRIVHLETIVKLVRQAPVEFLLVLLTAAAVIVPPIQTRVAIGVCPSPLPGMSMTIRTRPVERHRLPGTGVGGRAGSSGHGDRQEGGAVIAFQAPLLFANAEIFKRSMVATIAANVSSPSLVVLGASGIADIVFTA